MPEYASHMRVTNLDSNLSCNSYVINSSSSVTLDVTLNGTEMTVLAILKQKPDSSRGEIAKKISKTVRTVQRALDSLRDKGYIQRVGSKQDPQWEVLK